jgi:CTP synthase (UTP-ammonia lyase)
VLGIHDAAHEEIAAHKEIAGHEETAPHASSLVISRLTCSLVGETQMVRILPGTLTHQAYGRERAAESFRCSYGLNPAYRDRIEGGALRVVGVDPEGGARVVELSGHRFFVATLFLPQLASRPGMPHPLIVAFLNAAIR